MLNLAISDIETAELILDKWATKAIGLIDPECRNGIAPRDGYLQQYFHDCDQEHYDDCQPIVPQKSHIEQILAFSRTFTKDDRILVHCHAGISRSSAVAIAIFTQHGLEPFEAFYAVERIRPEMYPNRLVIRHADDVLGKNGAMVDYLDIWLQNFKP